MDIAEQMNYVRTLLSSAPREHWTQEYAWLHSFYEKGGQVVSDYIIGHMKTLDWWDETKWKQYTDAKKALCECYEFERGVRTLTKENISGYPFHEHPSKLAPTLLCIWQGLLCDMVIHSYYDDYEHHLSIHFDLESQCIDHFLLLALGGHTKVPTEDLTTIKDALRSIRKSMLEHQYDEQLFRVLGLIYAFLMSPFHISDDFMRYFFAYADALGTSVSAKIRDSGRKLLQMMLEDYLRNEHLVWPRHMDEEDSSVRTRTFGSLPSHTSNMIRVEDYFWE